MDARVLSPEVERTIYGIFIDRAGSPAELDIMAKICQVTGKKGNTTAKFIRNRHSQGWKYKAPKKNRTQEVNLRRHSAQDAGWHLSHYGGRFRDQVACFQRSRLWPPPDSKILAAEAHLLLRPEPKKRKEPERVCAQALFVSE